MMLFWTLFKKFYALISYIFSFFGSSPSPSGAKNPIVMIPCLGGSQIEVKMDEGAEISPGCLEPSDDFYTLYVNLTYILLNLPACLFEALSLTYDFETHQTNNLPGLETRVSGFDDLDTVRYLDGAGFVIPLYNKLIITLINELGYIPGKSLRAAPYDFRKGPHELKEYFHDLKKLIEETYAQNGKNRVILVHHSLGGPVALAFLRQQSQDWKDHFIEYQISLAASWGGAVKTMDAYINGFGFRGTEFIPYYGYDSLSNVSLEPLYRYFILPHITLIPKKMLRTFPAIIWSFPSPAVWNSTDILVQMNGKNYTLGNIEEFFRDVGEPSGWEMYKDILPYVKELPDPGIDTYCIYGTDIRTIALVHVKETFWDLFRYPINGDGDGIVNLKSLEVCKNWIGGKKKVVVQTFWGVDHFWVVSRSAVLNYVVNVIRDR